MKEIRVGLLGLGNVGAGVIRLLFENAEAIEARLGARVTVAKAAVRDTAKERQVDVDPGLITSDANSVIDDPSIDIVCELVGGTTAARDYVLRAIRAGKHVVTANKALLAVHGEEVFAAAEAAGVDVYYEAAVCGGVPIIRALREGLASDRIEEFYGIVNGTSNFILSEMAASPKPFAEVLADAQACGLAEADPTLDVSGMDAAHKLAILIMLCFGTSVPVEQIYVEGITGLKPIDFEQAARFGYVIKALAIGRAHEDGIEARVHPVMVPNNWMLADVPGAKNALYVRSYALGASLYYGAGAGMMPTAMAVVSDLIEVARNVRADATGALPLRSYKRMVERPVRSMDRLSSSYYMRFAVLDRPGVLGQLTTILGVHQVSIARVLQEAQGDADEPVSVVVLTHTACEGDLNAALAELAELEAVLEPAQVIRIAE